MKKEEILYWAQRYDSEEDLDFYGFEKSFGSKVKSQRLFSKSDLVDILKWKFQGRLRGRGEYFIEKLRSKDDETIEKLSSEAFNEPDETQRMKLFDQIPGIGPSVASVILTLYDPQNYGVLDIHVWREFFGKEPKNFYTVANYFSLLGKMREKAALHSLSVRKIEKAYFKKKSRTSQKKTSKKLRRR